MRSVLALGFLGAFLGAASTAQATLVVFDDGRHLRVASYEVVEGDRLTASEEPGLGVRPVAGRAG